MIVGPFWEWTYMGPPKTGSTTLHRYLVQPPFHGMSVGGQHDTRNRPFGPLFFSVRHPLTRSLSLWQHYLNHTRSGITFRGFLNKVEEGSLNDFFSRSVTWWLSQQLPVGIAVRQERMIQDLAKALGLNPKKIPPIPIHNHTNHGVLAPRASWDQITRLWGEDLQWYE